MEVEAQVRKPRQDYSCAGENMIGDDSHGVSDCCDGGVTIVTYLKLNLATERTRKPIRCSHAIKAMNTITANVAS